MSLLRVFPTNRNSADLPQTRLAEPSTPSFTPTICIPRLWSSLAFLAGSPSDFLSAPIYGGGQTLYTSEVTGEKWGKGINIPGVPPEVVFASIFKFL